MRPERASWTRSRTRSAEDEFLAHIRKTTCIVEDCLRPAMPEFKVELCLDHAMRVYDDFTAMQQVARLISVVYAGRPDDWDIPKERAQGQPVVYYVRMAEHIKIGTSRHLLSRLQTLHVHPDALLAVEPGDYDVEGQRHEEFSADRVRGTELFSPSRRLAHHIKQVRADHGEPTNFLQ